MVPERDIRQFMSDVTNKLSSICGNTSGITIDLGPLETLLQQILDEPDIEFKELAEYEYCDDSGNVYSVKVCAKTEDGVEVETRTIIWDITNAQEIASLPAGTVPCGQIEECPEIGSQGIISDWNVLKP